MAMIPVKVGQDVRPKGLVRMMPGWKMTKNIPHGYTGGITTFTHGSDKVTITTQMYKVTKIASK